MSDACLSLKVDSLVSQMDQFSKQIEQYLDDNGNDDEKKISVNEDSNIQCFKLNLTDLLATKRYSMLRDYQQYGIKWLMTLHASGLNGIIADEMGLGKTLQVIKFLSVLKNQCGVIGPHLMVGPLSVLSNWYHEIERYAPGEFDIHVHYGTKKEREVHLRKSCREWKHRLNSPVQKSTRIAIILTTFTIALHDGTAFKSVKYWCGKSMDYLILDEAHRIKNQSCVLYKQLREFPLSHRLLLTGTPLQNNLQELWSLLKFLVPTLFPKHEDIQEWFNKYFHFDENGVTTDNTSVDCRDSTTRKKSSLFQSKVWSPRLEQSHKNITSITVDSLQAKHKEYITSSLQRVLKPFILRRVKADVALDIPHKVD